MILVHLEKDFSLFFFFFNFLYFEAGVEAQHYGLYILYILLSI